MKWMHRPSACVALLGLIATGCTSLREVPRSQYAAAPERKNVRVVTQDGLTFDFDYVNVAGDSLVGYRERDVAGPVNEFATVQVPLGDIAKLSVRGLSWTRTGLIGGGLVAAIVARGLVTTRDDPSGGDGGGLPGDRDH